MRPDYLTFMSAIALLGAACTSVGLGPPELTEERPERVALVPSSPQTPLDCDAFSEQASSPYVLPFPANEAITAGASVVDRAVCPSNLPVTERRVTMTNMTGNRFTEVWYVADPNETSFSNHDGTINGVDIAALHLVRFRFTYVYLFFQADQRQLIAFSSSYQHCGVMPRES